MNVEARRCCFLIKHVIEAYKKSLQRKRNASQRCFLFFALWSASSIISVRDLKFHSWTFPQSFLSLSDVCDVCRTRKKPDWNRQDFELKMLIISTIWKHLKLSQEIISDLTLFLDQRVRAFDSNSLPLTWLVSNNCAFQNLSWSFIDRSITNTKVKSCATWPFDCF